MRIRHETNWGLEFTWFGDRPFMDNNNWDVITDSQTLNLTPHSPPPTFARVAASLGAC
ncbi:MAG: hypothetical protein JRS35_12585 [Deltaproteobacteria bacterium]|nr:hypothetical protein [Deltaproteobacteria bacterium]